MSDLKKNATLMVECLKAEQVEVVFGLPGEENIDLVDALYDSDIRFILTRHEQGAAFMADMYGRLTHRAGVCLATLGPGAINLALGVANAQLDSSPLVAIAGQGALNRLFKESHQLVDLVAFFNPITKWAERIHLTETTPEIFRKAFKLAETNRPGATAIVVPEDMAKTQTNLTPLPKQKPKLGAPNAAQLKRAVEVIQSAKHPLVLIGNEVCRLEAGEAATAFIHHTNLPFVTTFMGKGAVSEADPNCLGTLGFMKRDYVNEALDAADCVIAIGYDLIEFGPNRWNVNGDKQIIHINSLPAEVDRNYVIAVGIEGDIATILSALQASLSAREERDFSTIAPRYEAERDAYRDDTSFPLKPQKIVSDLRSALDPSDILLCDTGAFKSWVARLYPALEPNTCFFSNGLGTMAYSLPGAIGAKLACPDKRVIATMGDGSFLMNSQEIETAKRENIPFVILVWRDEHYGLIEWKQNLELGRSVNVTFTNPDLVKYAESFGIKGVRIERAADLLPALQAALASDEIVLIDCPVDYSENMKLTDGLRQL